MNQLVRDFASEVIRTHASLEHARQSLDAWCRRWMTAGTRLAGIDSSMSGAPSSSLGALRAAAGNARIALSKRDDAALIASVVSLRGEMEDLLEQDGPWHEALASADHDVSGIIEALYGLVSAREQLRDASHRVEGIVRSPRIASDSEAGDELRDLLAQLSDCLAVRDADGLAQGGFYATASGLLSAELIDGWKRWAGTARAFLPRESRKRPITHLVLVEDNAVTRNKIMWSVIRPLSAEDGSLIFDEMGQVFQDALSACDWATAQMAKPERERPRVLSICDLRIPLSPGSPDRRASYGEKAARALSDLGPVIVMTTQGHLRDALASTDGIAKDFVVKVAYAGDADQGYQTLLERSRAHIEPLRMDECSLEVLDYTGKTVVFNGVRVDLSPVDFALLRAMTDHRRSSVRVERPTLGETPAFVALRALEWRYRNRRQNQATETVLDSCAQFSACGALRALYVRLNRNAPSWCVRSNRPASACDDQMAQLVYDEMRPPDGAAAPRGNPFFGALWWLAKMEELQGAHELYDTLHRACKAARREHPDHGRPEAVFDEHAWFKAVLHLVERESGPPDPSAARHGWDWVSIRDHVAMQNMNVRDVGLIRGGARAPDQWIQGKLRDIKKTIESRLEQARRPAPTGDLSTLDTASGAHRLCTNPLRTALVASRGARRAPPRGVLITDGDGAYSASLHKLMESRGLAPVAVAASCSEARDQVRSHRQPFGALVLDVGLPNSPGDAPSIDAGLRFYAWLLRESPDTPVIFFAKALAPATRAKLVTVFGELAGRSSRADECTRHLVPKTGNVDEDSVGALAETRRAMLDARRGAVDPAESLGPLYTLELPPLPPGDTWDPMAYTLKVSDDRVVDSVHITRARSNPEARNALRLLHCLAEEPFDLMVDTDIMQELGVGGEMLHRMVIALRRSFSDCGLPGDYLIQGSGAYRLFGDTHGRPHAHT